MLASEKEVIENDKAKINQARFAAQRLVLADVRINAHW